MSAMTPEWRTRLRPGLYVVTVRGPEGLLLLDLGVALERRAEMGGTYEDTAVPEIRLCLAAASESLLVLATAEGIMGAQRAGNHGLEAAATTEPAEAGTTNVGGRAV